MSFPRPFVGVDAATRRLRLVLLGATLLGMLCCLPLWLHERAYPLVPIVPGFPQLSAPADRLFLTVQLLALVGACWFHRACVAFFLAAALCQFLGDQNRGQPWMYLYCVLLLLSLWSVDRAWAAMRVAISVSYVWAGVQKLNAEFFRLTPAWFVQPIRQWGWPETVVQAFELAVACAPFVEIALGVGVWTRLRRGALLTVVALHAVSLVLLGPLGHRVNLVVWPWNLAMMGLMLLLFPAARASSTILQTWRTLRRSPAVGVVLLLFALLPGLSYWGCWDSYFSFALYSANAARADMYVSEHFRDHLTPQLRQFVAPVKDFDPSFQKPCLFHHLKWAESELGVPPIPEPRAFAAVFAMLSKDARGEQDCHMIVRTRAGRVLLLAPGQAPRVIGQGPGSGAR